MKNIFERKHLSTLLFTAVFIVSLPEAIYGSRAVARRAPTPELKVSDYISYIENSTKGNALFDREKDLLYLSKFAVETVGLKSIPMVGRASAPVNTLAKQLRLVDIVKAFEQKIYSPEAWVVKPEQKNIQKITKDRVRLKKLLHTSEYSWAWVLKQLGKPQESRSLLKVLFDKEYQRVMALKRITKRFGRMPLEHSEHILGALNSMVDQEKQGALNEKMRKMKVHISKLPESHIVTLL